MPRRDILQISWNGIDAEHVRDGITIWRLPGNAPRSSDHPEIMRVRYEPGTRVEAHTHRVDYTEIILEGDEVVGRSRVAAGDVRVVAAGEVYGPIVAGAHGTLKLVIFAGQDCEVVAATSPEARATRRRPTSPR